MKTDKMTQPELVKFLVDVYGYHPDDISSLTLDELRRELAAARAITSRGE